jgi:hypothetical protein
VQGWQPDPLGRHGERWLSAGKPTDLVRDGARESYDPPIPSAASQAPSPPHWIDVDRIPLGSSPSPPWPLNRLKPSFPVPQPQPPARWQAILGTVATCCAVLCLLAIHFGHAVIPPKPLGPDEAIGTVLFVESDHCVMASYTPQGGSDSNTDGLASGCVSGAAAVGQTVLVRYNSGPDSGTVLTQPPPHSRPNGLYGTLVVSTALALGSWGWVVSIRRRWRRIQAIEDATDYRMDPWVGTTNSA